MRRHLHKAPELGNRENKTQAYIAAKLKEYGIDEVHTGFGEAKTAVIGVLNPQKGDAVGLRADIDALLIKENTELPFSSRAKVKGGVRPWTSRTCAATTCTRPCSCRPPGSSPRTKCKSPARWCSCFNQPKRGTPSTIPSRPAR